MRTVPRASPGRAETAGRHERTDVLTRNYAGRTVSNDLLRGLVDLFLRPRLERDAWKMSCGRTNLLQPALAAEAAHRSNLPYLPAPLSVSTRRVDFAAR